MQFDDDYFTGMSMYSYEGLPHLRDALKQETLGMLHSSRKSDQIVFKNIPPDTIDYILTAHEDNFYYPRTPLFDKDNKFLVFESLGTSHEVTGEKLHSIIDRELERLEIKDKTIALARTTFSSYDMSICKEADYSWGLSPHLRGVDDPKWPRIAVEIGDSEPRAKLREDARFWLVEGGINTTRVLTLDLQPKRIILALWALKAHDKDEIEITAEMAVRNSGSGVWEAEPGTSMAIQIDVASMLGRHTPPIAREEPMVITLEDLMDIAHMIEEGKVIDRKL